MTNGAKLSLTFISLTILLMAALFSGVIKSEHWNIENIEINAEFKRVNPEQIRVVVATYPERSFFKVDTLRIKEAIKDLPWVQKATVTKKWPKSLIITIIEHKAVAVWNKNKLLNEKGEIFAVDTLDDLTNLPQINGQDTDSQLIWDKYIRFNDIVKNSGYDISSSTISNRGGWRLVLSNGMNVILGTKQMDAKLVRLMDTWKSLLNQNDETPQYIDLRYTNGYVVKWQQKNNDAITLKAQQNSGLTNG